MSNEVITQEDVTKNRQLIASVRQGLKTLPQLDVTLTHHFAQGIYGREGIIPAGAVTVARVHKQSQIQVMLTGSMSMFTETGMKKITAPCVWVAEAGVERTTYYHEDTHRITIIGTELKDPEVIFNVCTEETYQDYLLSCEELLKLKDN